MFKVLAITTVIAVIAFAFGGCEGSSPNSRGYTAQRIAGPVDAGKWYESQDVKRYLGASTQ